MGQINTDDLLTSEILSCASSAPYAHYADWMDFLGISARDIVVLAKVYYFQIAYDNGEGEQYRHLSLGEMGKALNIDRSNLHKVLKGLVESGLVVKEPNGACVPATYRLDESRCMLVAIANGYTSEYVHMTRGQALGILKAEDRA